MFYINFVSASEKHILWLKYRIDKLVKINGSMDMVKRNGVYKLKYAKKDSKILISKMYYKKKLPYLKRKYTKLIKFLLIDNGEMEREKARVM